MISHQDSLKLVLDILLCIYILITEVVKKDELLQHDGVFYMADTALSKLKCLQLMHSLKYVDFYHQEGHSLVGKFTFTGGES